MSFIIVPVERNVLGPRVRSARKAARPAVTQAELAARLQVLGVGMDQSVLSKIESRRRPVSDIAVAALAEALTVPMAWLLGGDDQRPGLGL